MTALGAVSPFTDPRDGRRAQLELIADAEHLIELRVLHSGPVSKRWCRTPAGADETAASLTQRGVDVFVGMLPRLGREGDQQRQYAPSRVLWVDCDTARSVHKLADFDPQPTLTVLSGGEDQGVAKRHATWLLEHPVDPGEIRRHLRALAHHLDGDLASCDAGRVLRLVGSRHHQTRRVATAVGFTGEIHDLARVTGELPDAPGAAGYGSGQHPTPTNRVAHGERHPYLIDFCVRLLRAGVTDHRRLVVHLRLEFELSCDRSPAPADGYFEQLADWGLRSRIAGQERDTADFADRWAGRKGNGAAP